MQYTIGQIEKLTGIKAHTLRYWEEVIPSLRPKKDIGGRRTYTQKDLETILRLKYLINEKQYTIEGAKKQIMSELDVIENNAETLMEIQNLRATLTELYLSLKHQS